MAGKEHGNCKYTPARTRKIETYLKRCAEKGVCPTIEGVSMEMDITSRTIRRWRKRYKPFRRVLNMLDIQQRRMLIENSLAKKWDSKFSQFLLAVNHGMIETKKTVHDVDTQVLDRMKELHNVIEEFASGRK